MFVNIKNGKVVDVSGGRDREANRVGVWRKNGSKAQKWTVIYEDKKAKERTRGLNEDFGFQINRPFYIITKMPSRRVAEAVGGGRNVVLKTLRKGARPQQFWFDQKRKTIVSQQWQDMSMEIRGHNLRMGKTNAR